MSRWGTLRWVAGTMLVLCLWSTPRTVRAETPTELAKQLTEVQRELEKTEQDVRALQRSAPLSLDAEGSLVKVKKKVGRIRAELERQQQGSLPDDVTLTIVVSLAGVAIAWRFISAREANVRERLETLRARDKVKSAEPQLESAREHIKLLTELFTKSKLPLADVLTQLRDLEIAMSRKIGATVDPLQQHANAVQREVDALRREVDALGPQVKALEKSHNP